MWWNKRTKVEKCCILLLALCVAVIVYLASNLFLKFPSNDETKSVCMTEKCIQTSARILSSIDPKVNPCDDFYKFACGNFIKKTVIPEDKVAASTFSFLNDKVVLQLRNILEAPLVDTDPKYVKLVKTVYKSCMNTTQIEKNSLNYFKTKFREFGGWPVLIGDWIERNFDWKKLLYRFRKIGWRKNMFINLSIGKDNKNSSKRILTVTQPCMGYEMLKKGLNDSVVQAQYNFMVSLATLFGANRLDAALDMKDVIEFEIDIAKIVIPSEQRKNSTLEYNPITIRQLQRNFTTIPWLQFINSYLAPDDVLTSDDVVNVAVPKFVKDLEGLLLNTRKRTLANYMFMRIVRDSIWLLPDLFRQEQQEFLKVAYGMKKATPMWEQCVSATGQLPLALSAIFVKNYFDISVQHKVTELVLDVKGALIETLGNIGWMDKKTKKHALLKAEKMESIIAFPFEILDDDNVNREYDGLELDPVDGNYLEAVYNMSLFDHTRTVLALREPVTKNDWRHFSETLHYVNAFYDPSVNSIDLPAAILQDVMYESERPQYMNYGAIGSIIGHEVTHGFDDEGRQYDKDGNLIDWWEPETNRTFARKSQCLVEQYGNYTIPDIEVNLNGVNILGENIADNGGIKIAYRGYLKWLERNKEELTLPGLKYTPKQMFWLSTASIWCAKFKKEYMAQMVMSESHAPSYFRVVIPFMNSDYFARDFNCKLGSKMNPKYKCRVW